MVWAVRMAGVDSAMDYSSSHSASASSPAATHASHNSPGSSQRARKYNFRTSSVLNRQETEIRQTEPRKPKPKCRPPPLSKYRRKTANARERVRMQEVNDAFDQLRNVIPQYPAEKGKITKITTLTLALNYIKALREVLGYQSEAPSPGSHPSSSSAGGSEHCLSPGGSSQGHGSGLDSEGESMTSS